MPEPVAPERSTSKPLVIGLEIVANFVLPYVVYTWTAKRYGEVWGLLACTLPALVWSLVQFLRKRTLDAVSILVLAGIVLSLLAVIGGGSARFLQLRENLVTGLIGIAFVVSAAIRRPLIFVLARAAIRRQSLEESEGFASMQQHRGFRRTMTVLTLVWGCGLLAQTAAACVLVYAVPIPTYLLLSPFLGYGSMGLLALWTVWYSRKRRRERDQEIRREVTAPRPTSV